MTADASAPEQVDAATRAALRETILDMLHSRTGTMCPSEAPRRVRPASWRCAHVCAFPPSAHFFEALPRRRPLMEATRDVARALAAEGLLLVTQRGIVVDTTQLWRGPIRLKLTASNAKSC